MAAAIGRAACVHRCCEAEDELCRLLPTVAFGHRAGWRAACAQLAVRSRVVGSRVGRADPVGLHYALALDLKLRKSESSPREGKPVRLAYAH